MTPIEFERLRQRWYRKAGIVDIERPFDNANPARGDILTYVPGARSYEAQDAEFAGEMVEAARAAIDDPALPPKARRIWRRYCDGRTYSEIAAEIGCSFRLVSTSISLARSLMLRPTQREIDIMEKRKGPGRPPTMHARGSAGLTACGKVADKDRLTTPGASNCAACQKALGIAAKPKAAKLVKPKREKAVKASKPARRPRNVLQAAAAGADIEAADFAFDVPPEVSSADLAFQDIEHTIGLGVEIAHRKIVEIRHRPRLEIGDIADNERAVRTLLAVRQSELAYLKNRVPPAQPASTEQVQGAIAEAAHS